MSGAAALPWPDIASVFLDMDGTLLDLHFDNHFWLTHVPRRFAEKHALPYEEARPRVLARYQAVAGTLDWYCVDYWTRELDLDIVRLKEEVAQLIAVHPHVEEFLARARGAGKRVLLVTNAHHKSVSLKMRMTGIEGHFNAVVSAHDLGTPKEDPRFWERLRSLEAYDPGRTLLVDDSLPVLRSARDYGIRHLLGVRAPDSRQPPKAVEEFDSIADFSELLPGQIQ
ncbi:MAG TPA: GMP/IMP nucleotidase [Burkholderiales bacterium]